MTLWRKLKNLAARRTLDRDMQEELDALAALAEPGELGNLTRAAEDARAVQGWPWLDQLFQDLRYAARQCRRSPGFTAVAITMLAVGIGANAAVFSQMSAVLWSVLPVKTPDQVRFLGWTGPAPDGNPLGNVTVTDNAFSYAEYAAMRPAAGFSDLACWAPANPNRPVVAPGWGSIAAQDVSGNYFAMLGVAAQLGRTLTPDDDQPGGSAAVISYGLWQRAYGGDPAAVGKTLNVNGTPLRIVGVMPAGFFGLDPAAAADAWTPIRAVRTPQGQLNDRRGCRVAGRLATGRSDEAARAEAESLLRLGAPETSAERRLLLDDALHGANTLRQSTSYYLRMALIVTGAVLLIACANIAGLLLVRGAARERELATRLAIGAARGRIVRQLVTESFLLTAAGGVAAAALALALRPYFATLLPRLLSTPLGQSPELGVTAHMDGRVFAFTAAATAAAWLLSSLAPALRASRTGIALAMKGSAAGRFHFAPGKVLVAFQVALSVTLLVGAGLLLRTVTNLRSAPLGYDPEGLLTVRVEPRLSGYDRERRNDYFERAVRRLEQIPAVTSASGSVIPPIGGIQATLSPPPGSTEGTPFNSVGPRFFQTWRWPVISGREIEWSDRSDRKVALVNEAFVQRYLGGRNPVGTQPDAAGNGWTIVGVVANSRSGPREHAVPTLFPAFWNVGPLMTLVVRTAGDPEALAPTVRQVLAEIDPGVDVIEINLPARIRDARINGEIMTAGLLATVSGLALALCAAGLFGMLAYIVNRRIPEIGIRMALGAQRANVVRMVLGESLWPVAAGIAIGVGAALPLTRFVRGLLFGVGRYDPWSIAGAGVVLLLTAALAAILPARRAVRVDPMRALRHE